ncbi:plasma kallikrein [Amia ocellicauda]|uniref:plasma kallikrein n=1 Tax=Amia ocellicauda TaxID=2972642 RepID=UPI0034647B9D|nr:KLKB1 protein [Amia calva]
MLFLQLLFSVLLLNTCEVSSSPLFGTFVDGPNLDSQFHWRWLVGVDVITGGSGTIYPGILVGAKWVLTAQHIFNGASISRSRVWGGDNDLRQGNASQIRHVYRHSYDLALVELETPFNLAYIALPYPNSMPPSNARCFVAAWKSLHRLNRWHPVSGDIEVTSCGRYYPHRFDTFCASSESGTRLCQGDSGGPMFCYAGRSYILYGVVSEGQRDCNSHVSVPTLFSKVSRVVNWIRSKM